VSCVVIGLPACGDGGEAGPATPTRTQAFGLVQVGGGLNFMHAPHSEGNMPAPLSALPEDIPYSHPLRAAAGQNLVFDVQDGPAGQRFVVMDGSWGDSELDGQIYAFSGIGLVDVEVADAPELESIRQIKLLEDPGFEALTEPAHVVLPAAFEAKILSDPSADYNFTVSLAKAQEVNTNDFVNAYIQYGFVNTLKDYQDAVGESLMARAAIIELLQSPIVHFIISRGGEVDYACELSYCVTGRLKGSDILALAQEPNVYRVEDGDDTLVDDNATAGEVNEGLQAQQFFDAGFVNDRATHPESSRYLAVFERRMLTEHDAWGLFNGSNSTDRLTVYRCRKRLCSPASPLPQNSLRSAQHPMSVLSNVIADARGGGAGHQTFLDRRGSAHATPRVFFYAAASVENQSGTIQAPRGDRMRTMTTLDHVIKSRLSEPRLNVLTMSASLEGADSKDVDCAGDTDVGNQMGTLYESGLLTFKSTGNIGPTSPESCTVTEPGTARGVFALGNAHIAAGGGRPGRQGRPAGAEVAPGRGVLRRRPRPHDHRPRPGLATQQQARHRRGLVLVHVRRHEQRHPRRGRGGDEPEGFLREQDLDPHRCPGRPARPDAAHGRWHRGAPRLGQGWLREQVGGGAPAHEEVHGRPGRAGRDMDHHPVRQRRREALPRVAPPDFRGRRHDARGHLLL